MKITAAILGLMVVGVLSASDSRQDTNEISRQSKLGFLGSTTNTLSQLAQDLFARSTTSSQVLSLNLTNLVILLVVKALIFGAGSLGFGGHGDHVGRSVDEPSRGNATSTDPYITESEILLMLSYLKSDITQHYGCLKYAACKDPKKTKEYLLASNLLVKGANMFNLSTNGKKYENLLEEVEEAVNFGAKGYDCTARYSCEGSS